MRRAVDLLTRLDADGNVAGGATATARANLAAAASVADGVGGADLVVEAVVERADVKAEVYAEIEAAAMDDAVIATNTSSIRSRSSPPASAARSRFLGVHWFVPPLLVPCVEVIPGPSIDAPPGRRRRPRGADAARQVAVRRRRRPRVRGQPNPVRDVPGGGADRRGGIATPEQVDEVVRSSFGFGCRSSGRSRCRHGGPGRLRRHLRDARARPRPGLLRPRGTAGARRPRRVRRQDGTRVPGAVAGAGGRADRPEEPRVRRARAASGGSIES